MKQSACVACLLAGMTIVPSPALTNEMPAFFSGGQTYAEKPEDCIGPNETMDRERPVTINREGLSAHEFGCWFVEFKPVINTFAEPGTPPDTYLATASCGDDSGITRPDIFNLSVYDTSLWVTSQNDYMYDLLRPREPDDYASWGFVNKEYILCQPE